MVCRERSQGPDHAGRAHRPGLQEPARGGESGHVLSGPRLPPCNDCAFRRVRCLQLENVLGRPPRQRHPRGERLGGRVLQRFQRAGKGKPPHRGELRHQPCLRAVQRHGAGPRRTADRQHPPGGQLVQAGGVRRDTEGREGAGTRTGIRRFHALHRFPVRHSPPDVGLPQQCEGPRA